MPTKPKKSPETKKSKLTILRSVYRYTALAVLVVTMGLAVAAGGAV